MVSVGLVVLAEIGGPAVAQETPEKPMLVLDPGGHTAIVAQVAFTPDGRHLVSFSHDKTIRIWDVFTGEPLRVLRPPIGPARQGMLYAGAVSPDGRLLAVAGLVVPSRTESNIELISLDAERMERVLTGHSDAIFALDFSRDGRLLASGGTDRTARIWDTQTGVCRHELLGHGSAIADVAFSPDGQSLATACRDGTARIWSVANGQTTAVLAGHRDDIGSIAWSPDGRTVATGSDDGSIRLWAADGTLRTSHPRRGGEVVSLAFSADGQRLLYVLSADAERCGGYVLDLASGQVRASFVGYDTSAYAGALSPDGTLAATTGGSTNEISLWTTDAGTLVHRLSGGARSVVSCGWSPDGTTIAWGSALRPTSYNDYGPLERAFQLAELEPIPLPAGPLRRAQAAGDQAFLEKTGDYGIQFRAATQGPTPLALGPRERVHCGTLIPGDRAVVGTSQGLWVFDTRSGRKTGDLRGHAGPVYAVAPSPDDRYLLSASTDQTLRIWDPLRGQLLSLFFVGSEWVAWTPKGYYACSAGGERLMGWQINHGWDQMASYYPAVRFRKSLYRPDVIKLLLETGNPNEALRVANLESGRTGEATSVAEVLPPMVVITSPVGPKIEVSQATIEVRATATPRGEEGIQAMRLLLNGRPYLGRQGQRGIVRDRTQAAEPVEQSWTVQLAPGVHQIAVKAETAASSALSQPVEVSFAADQVERPALYVLTVGLSDHQSPRQRLQFGAKDARTLAEVFRNTSPPVFRDVQVQVLADQEATRRGILKGLNWLNEQMTSRDVAVFSFSGHGVRDRQGVFFLFPYDGEPKEVSVTGVSEEEIKRYCQTTPGRLLLLLDACHSGAIGGDFRPGEVAMADDLVRDLLTEDFGVIVMCSSMGREVSLENSEWGHGAFTLALAEGLRGGADYNKDNTVHLNEIDLYVADRVDKLTGGRQHPVTQKPTTIRSFPLAKP